MDSAEIAKTTEEMEAEIDVVTDAEYGDVMDAKTTAEMTNEKDAEILEIPCVRRSSSASSRFSTRSRDADDKRRELPRKVK